MTELPRGVTFAIEAYWDFWDVPRLMVARTTDGSRWLLDCSFDDQLDGYPDRFNVASVDANVAPETLREVCLRKEMGMTGSVPVACLVFDETRRSSFVVRQGPDATTT